MNAIPFYALVEVLGGVAAACAKLLHSMGKMAKETGHRDGTVYGTARGATRGFVTHHLRLISLAAVSGTALAMQRDARAIKSRLADHHPTFADFIPADPHAACTAPGLRDLPAATRARTVEAE